MTKVIFNQQFASVFSSSNTTLQCWPDSAACLRVPTSAGRILAFNQRLHPSCRSQLLLGYYSDKLPAANIIHTVASVGHNRGSIFLQLCSWISPVFQLCKNIAVCGRVEMSQVVRQSDKVVRLRSLDVDNIGVIWCLVSPDTTGQHAKGFGTKRFWLKYRFVLTSESSIFQYELTTVMHLFSYSQSFKWWEFCWSSPLILGFWKKKCEPNRHGSEDVLKFPKRERWMLLSWLTVMFKIPSDLQSLEPPAADRQQPYQANRCGSVINAGRFIMIILNTVKWIQYLQRWLSSTSGQRTITKHLWRKRA